MSPRGVPPRRASKALSPDAQLVARFRDDLARLIDLDRDTVLVAVSGGVDSLALLLLAHELLGDRCFAATVDHGLRPGSADEAATVAQVCTERGIPHRILAGDMPPRAGRTANLSARARLLRYRLLEAHAGAVGAAWLATAHHGDDQLETLLMRLDRGAGVAGLAGIRRRGGRIIRPLLGWRRADLARLVAACGVTAVDDPTNVDDRFDRARLRKVIAGVDWLDVERIGVSVAALGEAEDALAWTARHLMAERCTLAAQAATFDPTGLPQELVRRITRACVEHVEPAIELTGPGLTRLIEALGQGRRAMLGNVAAAASAEEGAVRWHFAPAPPRRSH